MRTASMRRSVKDAKLRLWLCPRLRRETLPADVIHLHTNALEAGRVLAPRVALIGVTSRRLDCFVSHVIGDVLYASAGIEA